MSEIAPSALLLMLNELREKQEALQARVAEIERKMASTPRSQSRSKKPSRVPALAKIDTFALGMAKRWIADRDIRTRVGEEEFAFRMFRAAARRGREIGREEEAQSQRRPRS